MRFAKQKIWKIARNSEISLKDGNNIHKDTNDIVVNKKKQLFMLFGTSQILKVQFKRNKQSGPLNDLTTMYYIE